MTCCWRCSLQGRAGCSLSPIMHNPMPALRKGGHINGEAELWGHVWLQAPSTTTLMAAPAVACRPAPRHRSPGGSSKQTGPWPWITTRDMRLRYV